VAGRVPLRQAIATSQGKRDRTRQVFATIADRYDLINVLLSFNRDRRWKRRLVQEAAVRPGERALDLACGTGDITFSLADEGAAAVGLDVTPRMIALARQKQGSRISRTSGPSNLQAAAGALFLVGDMLSLPFGSATFDVVTTGYGVRNAPDMRAALCEILRVLKPGGRFYSLDFNRPGNAVVGGAYLAYLSVVGSVIGWVVHRDAETYRYIAETVRVHPGGAAVAALLTSAGFEHASYEPVFGGFMAMHAARKAEHSVNDD